MSDRERLIELIQNAVGGCSRHWAEIIADRLLANDVVEVVMCKDCECCKLCYPAKAIGEEAIEGYYCNMFKQYRKPNDFCSYGELKEREG